MHELLPSAASPYTITATIGLQMELPRPQLSSGGHCTKYTKDHGALSPDGAECRSLVPGADGARWEVRKEPPCKYKWCSAYKAWSLLLTPLPEVRLPGSQQWLE